MKAKAIVFTWLTAALISYLSACAGLAASPENLIVPGKRIGAVFIGQNEPAVSRILGEPAIWDTSMGRQTNTYFLDAKHQERLVVHSHRDEDGHRYFVDVITTTSPRFATSGGISTASSLISIWRAFPSLRFSSIERGPDGEEIEMYDDDARGIGAAFTPPKNGKDRRCYSIFVFFPQGKKERQK